MPEQTAVKQQTAIITDSTPGSKPAQVARSVTITTKTIFNEFKAFFQWWYIEVPIQYIGFLQRLILVCDDVLSISFLFKTFFVPWHRHENYIGVFFGITIRILYIPFAVLITLILVLISLAVAILWALLPAIAVYFIARTPFM